MRVLIFVAMWMIPWMNFYKEITCKMKLNICHVVIVVYNFLLLVHTVNLTKYWAWTLCKLNHCIPLLTYLFTVPQFVSDSWIFDHTFLNWVDDQQSFYLSCSKVNLTHRHYARKMLSHLNIHQLKNEWKTFLALPEDQQYLEKGEIKRSDSWFHFKISVAGYVALALPYSLYTGAMFIARWILNEEDIDENGTYVELDRIACTVRESLRSNSSCTNGTSTNPLEEQMAQSNEEFRAVTHPTACLRLLDCLKHVLYQQLMFKGNVNEYYRKDNSMLYQV